MSQTDETDIFDFNYGEFNLIRKEQLNSPCFNPVEFEGFKTDRTFESDCYWADAGIDR